MADTAIWRPVVGWEGWYEVSDHGDIRRIAPQRGATPGKVLKSYLGKHGRVVVNLSRYGRVRQQKVHRLVAIAFLGDPGGGLEVCHGDGDTSNNQLTNLRWDTHVANYLDSVRHGTAFKMPPQSACNSGHNYTPENSYVAPNGKRHCRTCRRLNHQRRRELENKP